jgi:hypothetical protein
MASLEKYIQLVHNSVPTGKREVCDDPGSLWSLFGETLAASDGSDYKEVTRYVCEN